MERFPWFSLTRHPLLKKPFLRGFPVLLETLVNGIKALNRSAIVQGDEDETPISGPQLMLTMLLALFMAVLLFVVAPHGLSLLMQALGVGGGVEGLTFHLWDAFTSAAFSWAISGSSPLCRTYAGCSSIMGPSTRPSMLLRTAASWTSWPLPA